MNANHFNAAILVGWVLVLAGGMWIHPGAGLAVGGLLLIVLTLVAVRLGGGLYASTEGRAARRGGPEEVTG